MEKWKAQKGRKPLILQGARQVGKTWILKEFGKTHFPQLCYINFERSARLRGIFSQDYDIERILGIFQIETGVQINHNNTLLILDEIQEAEGGLTALKYFYENAPEYYVAAAGSLLGISMQQNKTFPVGKVDFLNLFPLSFAEFLLNSGNQLLETALQKAEWKTIEPFHEKLVDLLRIYYFVGGMPEAVQAYLDKGDFETVRIVQQNILTGYEQDFAKKAPAQIIPKIRLVWQSVLGQLAKENKKFIYGQIKSGARAKEFEGAIGWLVNAGLMYKCLLIQTPKTPLLAYSKMDAFKLFLLDIGLLNAMAELPKEILLEKNKILIEFKGA